MDILFIHGNYPAQFRHLCAGFGTNPSHRTVFLTARADAATDQIQGVKIAQYEQHRPVNSGTHHYLHATEEAVLQGQAVLRSLDLLMQDGFHPQLVIFHGGMGLGLFLRDVLPEAALIGYFEWWFTTETSKNLVESFDLNMQLSAGLRNLPTIQELERCDAAVVPTEWQKQQFPDLIRSKLHVIFDGIDTDFFHPPSDEVDEQTLVLHNRETGESFQFEPGTPILSYATRGMEPLRGFPEFMRALPIVFDNIKDLHVVIAGADRCAYSYPAPSHNGSWKKYLLEEINNSIPSKQVHFTGLLNYQDYRQLLWRSNLHCYLTHPYVTSWSLFEAASSGARLLISKGSATNGIADKSHAHWANISDQTQLNQLITKGIREGKSRASKRAKILPGYDLKSNLSKWESLITTALEKSKQRQ